MMPPRLTLVPRSDDIDDYTPREEPEAAEAVELARALSEADAVASGFATLSPERREQHRILEAVLFASSEPLDEARLAAYVGDATPISELMAELQTSYAGRGVNLVRVAGQWAFRTAGDLSYLLERHAVEERRLSKAALETLSIIAYHQPVTRAEIEDIRGVTTSAGTLDILMEAGWIRPRGRRRAPGKPITYGTTDSFLAHFSLDTVRDLPGLADLKAAGLLDGHLPPGFTMPDPKSVAALMPDELPLDAADEEDSDEEDTDADDGDDEGDELALPEGQARTKPDEAGD